MKLYILRDVFSLISLKTKVFFWCFARICRHQSSPQFPKEVHFVHNLHNFYFCQQRETTCEMNLLCHAKKVWPLIRGFPAGLILSSQFSLLCQPFCNSALTDNRVVFCSVRCNYKTFLRHSCHKLWYVRSLYAMTYVVCIFNTYTVRKSRHLFTHLVHHLLLYKLFKNR